MITNVINVIKGDLVQTFDEVFGWFHVHHSLLHYSPNNKGWSIKKILEHIFLTNHYLLILIRKGTVKAIEKSGKSDYSDLLQDYNLDLEKLRIIGNHRSFEWHRPDHMEPKGKMSIDEIRDKLQLQMNECLGYLNKLQHGEGVLYKTMMSVSGLGKIDVYHYIYFLVQHARRHLAQLEKVEHEFNLGI
jgi:hypothetical protein